MDNKPILIKDVTDEKFEKIYSITDDEAQLLDGGRSFEQIKHLSYQCALGKNSYSSGIHRIRLKQHHGAGFFGIRSRHIQVEPDIYNTFQRTPSTYGWFTRGRRTVNGRYEDNRLELSDTEDVMIELVLNCDEHRLKIVISKGSNNEDEMEVDDLHASFPRCLFVELGRVGGRISLV